MRIKPPRMILRLRQPKRFRNPFKLASNPIAESLQLFRGVKRSGKYFAQRVNLFGQSFDSKAEFNRWMVLRGFQQQGVISGLARQHIFIYDNGKRYFADFLYVMDGQQWVEDVKSPALLKEFMVKAAKVERLYKIKVTPVHPKNVTLHPRLVHSENVLTHFST